MLCQRNAWSVWKEEKRCWATAEWGWGRACGQGRLLNSWVCQVQKKEPLSENTEVWYRWRVTCYLIFLEHGVWGREGWKILLREQGWKQRNLLRHTNKLQRRQWHPFPVLWKIPWTEEPGRLQSMGSLRVGHNWATSLSRIGEGNGNPLPCSCLENPRDCGAWWAAVSGVAHSRTRLTRLSSNRC